MGFRLSGFNDRGLLLFLERGLFKLEAHTHESDCSMKNHSFIHLTTGKLAEVKQLLGELTGVNLVSLMGQSRAEQKAQLKEREQKREKLKEQGMSDEEIAKVEAADETEAEKTAQETSSGNTLQDLEVREKAH